MASSLTVFVICLLTPRGPLRYECRANRWFTAYQHGLRQLPPETPLRAIVVRGRLLEARP